MVDLSKFLWLLPILCSVDVYGKTGEEIADALYQHPNECKDPPDGGIWAPLPGENPSCGPKKCNFPKEWCSATSDPKKSQDTPTLNCVSLPPDCQKAVRDDASTTTAAPTAGATSQSTTPSSSQATTAATSAASSAPSARPPVNGKPQSTAAPGGSTTSGPSANCKDNHEYCCFWAGTRDQCNQNPTWMRTNCQKSCGTCGCQSSSAQSCKVKVNTSGCKYLNGGGAGGNTVRIPLSGGNRLAAFGFGNSGGQGGNGTRSTIVQIPLSGGRGPFGFGGSGFGGGGNGSSIIRIPVRPGIVGMPGFGPFGNNASTGAGTGVGQQRQPNIVRIPVRGGGFGQGVGGAGVGAARPPGSSPFSNAGTPGNSGASGTGSGNANGRSPSIVTIPVGRKRRHFMPRWFN